MIEPVFLSLVLFLILIFIVGFWSAGKLRKKSRFLQEYFLGSREIGGFILAMTMVATYGSSSSFLSGAGAAYNEGLGWALLAMTQVATGYFVLMVLGKKFAIMARKYDAVTLVDFLRLRYGSKAITLISAFSIVVFIFAAVTAQWIGGAHLIASITDLNYTSALTIFAVVVIIYVIIGGFRAVVLTDSIQGVIMVGGTLVILIGTIIAGGGVTQIMGDLTAENPNLVTPYGADGSLTAAYVSSFWILVGVGVVALPQVAVRAMSYRNSQAMHRGIIVGTAVVGFIMLGIHLVGVFARPVLPGVEEVDQVMPLIAMEVLPAWLAGVVLAAPLAAIMSTVDSLLLLISSALVKDVYLNYIRPDAEERKVKQMTYIVTSVLGVLAFAAALTPPDLLLELNLFAFGGLQSAFIWPLIFGLYWQHSNKYGALSAMIVGVGSYTLIHNVWPEPFGLHSVVLPVVLSFFAFLVANLLTLKRT
ncbi:sodium/pantothenate symporter [Texcoconibacillus texcoconensis]|uniref:Sodium/pantothenate symporter n=1 Tax=Texcoconibacillus texcoconensis TaxID=1095777 RepID=A0A840QTV3_9BACI|nr:sodium/pantothenate symporter [Texcoconibacillus texcoconensis]MBB5174697.1 sodium/pantothenate symporter [Texcoconibacillus texcoconensis]